MNSHTTSSAVSCATDGSELKKSFNDLDLEKSPNNMLPKSQMEFFNIQALHRLATANLIAQTQETIAQQLNITADPHFIEQNKTKSQSPEKLIESGSRTLKGKIKRSASKSKSEDNAKRICVKKLNVDAGEEWKTTETKENKTAIHTTAEHCCTVCDEKFSSAAKLKIHLRIHKPLECQHPGCNKTFTWPSNFKYHQLTHAGEKKCKCDHDNCGQEFYTAQQLEVHQRTHNNNKPFICPEVGCARSFTTAGNLKNHLRCHTGEKPYICDYPQCDKRFAELSTLKKHIITHTGQKPYSCELCGKSFTQSSSRRVHMKSHCTTPTLEFNCDVNCQTFTQSDALREHVVTADSHLQEESSIVPEQMTENQVTQCVAKDESSGDNTHVASLHSDNIDSNAITEKVPTEIPNTARDETVLSEEELTAHLKLSASNPVDNIYIVYPSDMITD